MSATNPATGQTIQGGQASRDQWHELAQQLRVDSIRCTTAAGSGHPTSSMSAADLLAVLLAGYLRYDFANPKTPNNDHLIFSKGHASPLLYSVFKAAGAISDDELLTLRKRGSRLEGHPDAGPALGGCGDRLAGAGPADRRRRRAGGQVSGQAALPYLGACSAIARWRKARSGRRWSLARTTSSTTSSASST